MLSNKPYLLRAFFQWIVDSGCTPILVIDANNPQCKIPVDFVEGDEIVFNISPSAIRDLNIANDVVEFKASFSSVVHLIAAPIKGILAIYAEENGEGIFFDAEDDANDGEEEGGSTGETERPRLKQAASEAAGKKPFLKLVE